MARFIIKHKQDFTPSVKSVAHKNNIAENKEVMTTSEKIEIVNNILNNEEVQPTAKRIKKDKGLIEKTESSKIVLTEDNKELLID